MGPARDVNQRPLENNFASVLPKAFDESVVNISQSLFRDSFMELDKIVELEIFRATFVK